MTTDDHADVPMFRNPECEAVWQELLAFLDEQQDVEPARDAGELIMYALADSGLLTDERVHRSPQHPFYNQEKAWTVPFLLRATRHFSIYSKANSGAHGIDAGMQMLLLIACLDKPYANFHLYTPEGYAEWVEDAVYAFSHTAEDAYTHIRGELAVGVVDLPFVRALESSVRTWPDFYATFFAKLSGIQACPWEVFRINDSYVLYKRPEG